MKRQLLTFIVLAQLGGTLAACANIEVKTGCFADSDCFAGSVCIEGACVTPGDFECGNGRVEPGETCDGDCAEVCTDELACTSDSRLGSPDECNVFCEFDPITTCMSGDGCCPNGCDDTIDADCEPLPPCENGELDEGETDVDCGGAACDACEAGLACDSHDDCASGPCEENVCLPEGHCVVPGSTYLTVQFAIDDRTCEVIHLKPGTYREELFIPRALEIIGSGMKETTLDGEDSHRLINATSGNPGTLVIRDLEFEYGRAPWGGAIHAERDLRLESVRFRNNVATAEASDGEADVRGGAIFVEGSLTVLNSVFEQNKAELDLIVSESTSANAWGAAIYALSFRLLIEDSVFDRNEASINMVYETTGPEGGLHANAHGGAVCASTESALVSRSEFVSNKAIARVSSGDAEAVAGALTLGSVSEVEDSDLSGNKAIAEADGTAVVRGGATAGFISFRRTVLFGNQATAFGWDLASADGGAAYGGTFADSLVDRNRAIGGVQSTLRPTRAVQVRGGGLAVPSNIVNTTISGNSAERSLASISETRLDLWGGGVAGTPNIVNSTITRNRAEEGGGIYNWMVLGTTTRFKHTIVADNYGTVGPDCAEDSELVLSLLLSLGHNLVGATRDCDADFDLSDLLDQDPKLEPLANNGGPTETHLPADGSPVIDGGDPAGCTDAQGEPLTTDQRGEPRIGACDIGAVEVQ